MGDGVSALDPNNWFNNILPTATNIAVISGVGTNVTIVLGGDATVQVVQCSASLHISGGNLTVTKGNSQVAGTFTVSANQSLTVNGLGTIFTANGRANLNHANLYAQNGATISVPGIGQATRTGSGDVYWQASGAGSRIVLAGLTNVVGYADAGWWRFQAYNGGRVELPAVKTLTNGWFQAYAEGTAAVVDLSGLTSYQVGRPDHYLSLEARNGGAILIPRMTALDRVNLTLRNAGPMPLSGLWSITRGTVIIDGTHISLPNLAVTTGTTFQFLNDGSVDPLEPRLMPLLLNQTTNSSITRAFGVDHWEFSPLAGQSLTLDLIAASRPEIYFTLLGPSDWSGFLDKTNDFGPVTLPASGSYILEAAGRGYPVDYAFRVWETTQHDLEPGTNYTGQFVGSGQPVLFRVRLPAASPFFVTLQNNVSSNRVELYAKLGVAPMRGDFDYRFTGDPGPNQQLLIPTASSGTWYVLAYGETIFTPSDYTIAALAQDLIVADLAPRTHAMDAPITLTLTGAGFDRSTQGQLQSAVGTYPAAEVEVDSATQITAKFIAGAVPEGNYSVRLAKTNGSTAVLPGALTLVRGKVSKLETKLILPNSFGYHAVATVIVEYRNAGNVSMPAPLLIAKAMQNNKEGAWLTLKDHRLVSGFWTSARPEGFSHSVQILGSGATPGVLQPGESRQVPVYYADWQQPWDYGYPPIYWSVDPLTADNTSPCPGPAAIPAPASPATTSIPP